MNKFLSLTGGAALLAASLSAGAATQINVWHSLNQHNKKELESLVKQFNRHSSDVSVKLSAFESPDAIDAALSMATKESDLPHLVQLEEAYLPDMAASRNYIQPLHALLPKQSAGNIDWFLPVKNSSLRDSKGRLEAFPFMLDIPVMFYNLESFQKAGISPAAPKRSWMALQDQVVQVANNGSRQCPITADQPVSINLENLAAVNQQPYVNSNKGTSLFNFDTLYIRHLSLMITWVRSELMVKPEFNDVASQRFADGECAMLLSKSSNIGWFASQKGIQFGVSGLPYYPEVTAEPGLPFIGGGALWATKGHAKEDDVATVSFLSWLAQPEQATKWYQNTGFLPLTRTAFQNAKSDIGVAGQWNSLIAPYSTQPVALSHGFRINNYPEIRALLNQSIGSALGGQQTAVAALRAASEAASELSRK